MADGDPSGEVYILLGPPGVGKGTQAKELSRARGVPHVATGDILRGAAARGAPTGREAKEKYMDRGDLVPDKLVTRIVADRIAEEDCRRGAILDGFPRTRAQAKFLDEALGGLKLGLGRVFYLDASEDVVVERLAGRRSCPSCRAIFHLLHRPPAVDGKCDECGTALIWRDDDRAETVRERMVVYRRETAELAGFYEERGVLSRIDASGDVGSIRAAIEEELEATEG